ncbi:MAG: DUF3575 domain-containing protein [Tannerellaceae bacterium]|nr:DUF3575 domain-containing protein [Tannerellaceae bacterium]
MRRKNKLRLIIWIFGFSLIHIYSNPELNAQSIGLKNNILYDAILSPNLGIEVAVSNKVTIDLIGSYNPFTLKNDKKFRHWLVQPEARYWFCESFNGWFIGGHLHGGQYNFAKLHLPFGIKPQLKENRYEGFYYGAGISGGYQWMLGKRWNLEASLGLGYARFHYHKYDCTDYGPRTGHGNYHYLGPTKATISIIYIVK